MVLKGKITKPIDNVRFEDSPFFFLNSLEAIGPSQRIALYGSYVLPVINVRDFAFTSLADSV
jgi:predicted Zn-dependent protease